MKNYFEYKDKHLRCEGVSVASLAKKYGTPLFIYSQASFLTRLKALQNAFTKREPLICFSTKACSNIAILKLLVNAGAGLDIVSGGELYRAKKAGCPSERIVFAGVGKTVDEIEYAIKNKIHSFDVESLEELDRINQVAGRLKKTDVKVSLRINPEVDAQSHDYITTAKKESKFGIHFGQAKEAFQNRKKYKNLSMKGILIHIGSQITEVAPFIRALKKTVDFIRLNKLEIDTLNIGGGIGIIYDAEKTFETSEYAAQIESVLEGMDLQLIMEPGRFIAGNSGIFVSKVEYVKKSTAKDFLIVDGAMNDLIRPALYQAYHKILPVVKPSSSKRGVYDIVGPVCESGDFFAKNRSIVRLNQGDLLAVMSTGAYGFTMSSNYNSRPKAAEILVSGRSSYLIGKRETYRDIIRNEMIPKHLV